MGVPAYLSSQLISKYRSLEELTRSKHRETQKEIGECQEELQDLMREEIHKKFKRLHESSCNCVRSYCDRSEELWNTEAIKTAFDEEVFKKYKKQKAEEKPNSALANSNTNHA